jgi:TetR/AcrR family transcriptional regulator, transcriptional repressor for nem operon
MDNKVEEILKSAEIMVREGGYNAFSFREIAKIVGIKSSSVHYHFPTKSDLGAAVAKHYTNNFLDHLGVPKQHIESGKNPIEFYVQTFKNALINDKRVCLCGILGAEINSLPSEVKNEIKIFFERNIEWLIESYTLIDIKGDLHKKALQTLSLLEGAMIMSNVFGDINYFDAATSEVTL